MRTEFQCKCFRCENDIDIDEAIFIPTFDFLTIHAVKYLCYDCIADIAALLPLSYNRTVRTEVGLPNVWATYKTDKNTILQVRPDPAQIGPLRCPNRRCPKNKNFRSIASVYSHCTHRRKTGHPECLEAFVERFI